jgi:hypothetical protein
VFADLNFVTGHPHIVAGSPHIVAGSGLGFAAQAEESFRNQWAFKPPPGIGLPTPDQPSGSVSPGGPAVRVGVFDTSPFETEGVWDIPWITPTLSLCVSHLLPPIEILTPTADHGLFVAGLVHAVAPESEIHLIQVLDENALGDLNTLNTALDLFIRDRSAELGDPDYEIPLTNTVVNLSLGFPQPRRPTDYGLEELSGLHESLMNALATRSIPSQSPWPYGSDEMPVVSLETLLAAAEARGVVVVAAAGNESRPGQALPAEVPAAYPSVIGVAASNKAGRRACFSNQGDVAAPGGDSDVVGVFCAKELEDICGRGIIGPVLITSPCSGYACWAGTSFSAPMVSGLASLILEGQPGTSPAVVSETIRNNAVVPHNSDLQKGIIDVPASLPTPTP